MQINYIEVSCLFYQQLLSLFAAHYMASAPSPPPEEWDFFTDVANWLTLSCYGWFTTLVVLDLWRAITKRAIWLPGKAFSLTGVTVQLIVWWTSVSYLSNQCKNGSNLSASRVGKECKNEVGWEDLVELHQLALSGKVALCVFIGYLLPVMAAPSARTFLALGVSICVQIASELIVFKKNQHQDDSSEITSDWKTWMKIANSILFICVIVLGLILVCTILASQTIHGLLRQRISAIFPITQENEFQNPNNKKEPCSWNDFQEEVFSSWLVTHACQPDYVISRSVLSSAVGMVVTLCGIISIISNAVYNVYFETPFWAMDYAICALLFSFIIIGWVVICWRCLATQLYFRSHRQSWRRRLCLEDLWTRSTLELIHMSDLKRQRQRFQDDETLASKLQSLPTRIFTKFRLHKLVYLVLMLQLGAVYFSKLCSLLLEVTIGNFLYLFRKIMGKGQSVTLPDNYGKILELICMPGEDPSDLWEANKMSFDQVKLLMDKGCENYSSSDEMKSLFSPYSPEWAEEGKQLLNALHEKAFPSVSKHFPSVENHSVRITVVSLITIWIELHKARSPRPREILKVCGEVWDLLSFTDECDIDIQAKEINLVDDLNKDKDQVCMAAEREFYKLQMENDKTPDCKDSVINVQEPRKILEDLLMACKGVLVRENLLPECVLERENLLSINLETAVNLSDSKDWTEIAPKYNLCKLCVLMLTENIEDFVAWTEESFRNVIADCVSRLPNMLVKQFWKWAQKFEEDKFWKAIGLAGKCKGMMEQLGLEPELTMNNTMQRTSQSMQSV